MTDININISEDPELGPIQQPQQQNQQPTKKEVPIIEFYHKYFGYWDLYMAFESFVFFLSFILLLADDNTDPVVTATTSSFTGFIIKNPYERDYLYHFNGILVLDFVFRLLSIDIEMIRRETINDILHFVLPLVMWLLAAFYHFDNVFGSNPVQVLNALFFVMLNLIVIVIILFKFVTMDQIKNSMKRPMPRNQEQDNKEQDIEQECNQNKQEEIDRLSKQIADMQSQQEYNPSFKPYPPQEPEQNIV